MQYREPLIVDYGPSFIGQSVLVDEGVVCVVSSRLDPRSEESSSLREMVEMLGGNCGDCRNCPLGQTG